MPESDETIVTVETPAPPESAEPSEPLSSETETDSEQIEDVQTVADEILVEVKECRTKQEQTMAALEILQSEGGPAKQSQVAALETELKNCREELRNLLAELKALQVPALTAEGTRLSTQSLLPAATVTEITEINPAGVESPVERTAPKKKRYKI